MMNGLLGERGGGEVVRTYVRDANAAAAVGE